jgi:hypothetical protein
MRKRRANRFRPLFERLEAIRSLSIGASTAHVANLHPASGKPVASHLRAIGSGSASGTSAGNTSPRHSQLAAGATVSPLSARPMFGYLVYRITNPNIHNRTLIPPFMQLLIQSRQPIPGQVYNVLDVVVRNGTSKTFTASDGFSVQFPGQPSFPILTGAQEWQPGQQIVFYVLTKKYYPLPSVVTSGFEFILGGASSVAIPGPSGIFLRVRYDPATFARTLNWIVAYGPGNEGGKGAKFGLPNTAIYEFVSAKTNRMDFGGYF